MAPPLLLRPWQQGVNQVRYERDKALGNSTILLSKHEETQFEIYVSPARTVVVAGN